MAAAGAAALLALLAALVVVVTHSGASALPAVVNNHTSAARQLRGRSGGWQMAKATWYGAPYGAGPDDNGTYVRSSVSVSAMHRRRCAPPMLAVVLTFRILPMCRG
jgi:hypothetical protein